ncbi:ankyrin repeat domain-containing protein [Nonomuraea sp. NPDC005650]|uniref:ankyrin repeat domain-containing protein n=1 Tax=Nonomuraea sp. NPDC005650 TaxID=3157045 RepID=UPI0033A376F1
MTEHGLVPAATTGEAEEVRRLLDRGADPDVADSAGRTALSHAAERGGAAVVRALLDSGADPGPADGGGRRPVDLARRYAGRDLEAELVARATAYAPQDALITVRHETTAEGETRIVAEVRDGTGRRRSESWLGTGHAEIVRLLEARA